MEKAVILAGGIGSRLWPLSREAYPKQFVKFFDGKSLFQKTVERLEEIFGMDNIIVSTSRKYRFIVQNQLKEIGKAVKGNQIVVEPSGKNTLPAILLAMKYGGPGNYGVFPSDHIIADQEKFLESIESSRRLSGEYLVSMGIVPSTPHTGYGYIKPGKSLEGGFEIDRFIEKPDAETAEAYMKDGYFWNGCILFFNSEKFLREVRAHSPEYLAVYEEGESAYSRIKGTSVSRGVFEKTSRAAVVPLNSYWNDLGCFSSFFEVMENNDGVVTNTEVLNIGSKGNLVMGDNGKLVGLIDVEDLVVVDTSDALLIGSKDSSQKVKSIVNYLKENEDRRVRQHTLVYRPWGFFEMMQNDGGYRIRRVIIYPNKRLTNHRHFNRSEHWVIVSGTATVELEGKRFVVGPGESTFVPRGTAHKVENPGKIPLEMIEVQIGDYFGDNDVRRVAGDGVEDL